MICLPRFLSRRVLLAIALLYCTRSAAAADVRPESVIETISDERLVGKILDQTPEVVHFESATLGEVRVPRRNIRSISPSPTTGKAVAAAPAQTSGSPAPAAGPAAPKGRLRTLLNLPDTLNATLAGGASVKAGVLDQSLYTVSLTLDWQTGSNVFSSLQQYQYSKVGALLAADDFSSDNLLQHNFTEKVFGLAGANYRRDKVMAVDRQINIFVAPGVYLTKSATFEFGVAAGISQLWQDFGALIPGQTDPAATSDLGAAVYQFMVYRSLPRVLLTQNNLFNQSLRDNDKYIYRFMISATTALTDHLSLITAFGFGYDSKPAQGVGSSQNSLTSQLGYKF